MDVATSERLLDVAGMEMLVRTSTAEDLLLVSRVLGERPRGAERAQAPVTLVLDRDEPKMPGRDPDFAGPYGDHWISGGTAHFSHHWGLGARITPDEVLMGGPVTGHRRWVAVRNAMLFVLGHLYMARDRFLLHAAALHRSGTDGTPDATLLVVGDSGRGKSTLTFAGLQAGMTVMGDDMVVVTPAGQGLLAQGVPRVMTVPSEVLPSAPDGVELLPGDDRNRVELEGRELHAGAELVSGLVLCDHDSGGGRLAGTSLAETVGHLADAFVLSALVEPMRMWFPHALQLANGPASRLLHDSNPGTRIASARRMLETLTTGTHTASDT